MELLPAWRPLETIRLTAIQRTIVLLIADGLTNRAIAAQLGTTPGWVGTQVGRIVERLGVTCRADIVAKCRDADLYYLIHGH
jgi:DNA-binding NarL/FixJ family response regulator